MQLTAQVPLAPRTTLGLGGAARWFAEAHTPADVAEASREAQARGLPLLVLGGGSNLVVGDEGFDGLVLHMATRGVALRREGADMLVDVAAGEPWDDLVARTVGEGLAGLEALSGIPGLVGATPIQNVGAYGREVAQVLEAVEVYDTRAHRTRTLSREECGFRYRTSRFKHEPWLVVVSVRFRLSPPDSAGVAMGNVGYGEVARALGIAVGEAAPAAEVRQAVLALRARKGMVVDPADPESRSAGSFFTNVELPAEEVQLLEERLRARGLLAAGEEVPTFPTETGKRKVPAAWLVERSGFRKGDGAGAVGISRKHALALVHRGGGSARELLDLARRVRDGVRGATGLTLVPEPVFVGASLDP